MINRKTKIYIYGDLRIRAFRVAWICEELQLEWEMEKTFPWSDKMYEINPLGKVPVIREDDFYVYESGAILNYLADKYQEKTSAPLLPKAGTHERAIYDQFLMLIFSDLEGAGLWMHRRFIDLALHSANLDLMKELHYVHIPEVAKPAKYSFERAIKVLINQLEGNEYLLGDNFSTLDIHFLCDLEWAEALGWLSENPKKQLLDEYYDRVSRRPAFQKCSSMRRKLDITPKSLNTFTPRNRGRP